MKLHRLLAGVAVLCGACSSPSSSAPPADSEPMSLMSFNIRYGTAKDGLDSWPFRAEAVARTIRDEDPDLVALQEVLDFQHDFLADAFPGYALRGLFRGGERKDEFSGFLIRRDRFEILEDGGFWLSETPEQVGSQSWDAALPRVCAWVRLRDLPSDVEFVALATHFDHRGVRARTESARLIARRTEAWADLPIALMGDLNAVPDSEPLRILERAGFEGALVPRPSSDSTEHEAVGTFHGFDGRRDGPQIDFVLTRSVRGEGGLTHLSSGERRILRREFDGRYPSDHFPVVCEAWGRFAPESVSRDRK